jgi:serine/threonine-protein kinase
VIVPSMSPLLSSTGADGRPSWARLPAQRSGPGATRDSVAAAGKRVADWLPEAPVQRSLAAIGRGIDWLRNTAQGRRQLTIFVVVIGLALVAGGYWLGFGRYTAAPNLLQLTKDNAIAEASRQGFHVDYGAGIYTEQIPADTVMQQQPSPGGRIVKGGTVTLTLSLGPERYAVPDVRGQDVNFALTKMPKQLLVQTVDGFSDTLPPGYVVATDPEPGTLLKPNSPVKVVVARGPYPVHVPTVLGMKLSDATALLNSAGFTSIDVQHRDDAKPKDTVLEQNPNGGDGMASAAGQKVTIIVSNGPAAGPMPSVVGQTCKAASDLLTGMKLVVTMSGPADHTVTAQSIPANQAVKAGDAVTLTCAP